MAGLDVDWSPFPSEIHRIVKSVGQNRTIKERFDRYLSRPRLSQCVHGNGVTSEGQLRRQLSWLEGSWSWLMRNRVLGCSAENVRPSALDVGCGPGLVMELLAPMFDVKGVDLDISMVRTARGRGFETVQADALDLPFDDDSFDVVYCSFTLLWVSDPQRAVREMARVARGSVVCLAEPDYGGRICVPREVADLDRYLAEALAEEGADPYLGRKLGRMMESAGLRVEMGVHPGVWAPDRLREEAAAEWDAIAEAVRARVDGGTLDQAREAWNHALGDGSLFLFNPVFHAIGRK
jgi:SAM-dependent methyltransferase